MKNLTSITLTVMIGFFLATNVYAADRFDCIYGSKIDGIASFYQARIYLADSEYKILAEIGDDASNMIRFLEKNREMLIREMKDKCVELKTRKIRAYIVNRARFSDMVANSR